MDFDLSEEQRLLKESVGQMLADTYSFAARKSSTTHALGYNPEVWRRFAELGLFAVPFAEADGGIGGGPVEIMIVMDAIGRSLVVEPYLAQIVLAGGVIRHAASPSQRAAWLPDLISGTTRYAFAHPERASRYDLEVCETRAEHVGGDWLITGAKTLVQGGDSADQIIVSARTAGTARDRSGIALFRVSANAQGISRRGYPTQDGARAAEITLEKVHVAAGDAIGDPSAGLAVIERVTDEGLAAVCAEAVGAMDEMLRLTVDYLKTRKQFGTTIGSFQALQHRASDMFVATEQARSMAMLAAMMVEEPDPSERAKALAAAKVQIGRSGKFVSQQAVQLHGGVGVTMEYAIGHYMKRIAMIEPLFGDADHHLGRLARSGGLFGSG